jgi:succinate dehydrogenase / fumarate reductase cytochrome b subunit
MSDVQIKSNPSQTQVTFISSSIGKKVFMAVSGLLLFSFVVGHMIGNLQIFLGQDRLNTYAQALKDLPALVWFVRIFMFIFLVIHVWRGIQLYLENWFSRPRGYVYSATVQAPLASRTMIFTGAGILLYVVYHLLHFTLIVTNPQYAGLHDALGRHDVYSMVVLGFQNFLISGVYIVAMFSLCYHLTHAFKSLFQTLGLNNQRWEPRLNVLGYLIAIGIFVGYTAIPFAVMTNFITLPEGVH